MKGVGFSGFREWGTGNSVAVRDSTMRSLLRFGDQAFGQGGQLGAAVVGAPEQASVFEDAEDEADDKVPTPVFEKLGSGM